MIPSEKIFELIFTFDEDTDGAINVYFEELGYDSKNAVKNMGTGFLYLISLVGVLIILLILIQVNRKIHGLPI